MRILLAARVFWPNLGGIERHVQWLAEHLTKLGHTADIVTLNRAFEDGRDLPPYDRFEHPGGTTSHVWRVPYAGSNRYPIAPRIADFVRRYDVVHVHAIDFFADWMLATRACHRRPVVLSTHGGFFHTGFAPRLKKLWFHTLTRRLLSAVDALIYTSDQDEALFSTITRRGQLIRTGVSLDPWRTLKREPEPGRFVTVGRVDRHKGLGHLIASLALVPGDWRAEIVGPEVVPGLVATLRSEAAALGVEDRVRFLGRVDESVMHDTVRRAELGLWPAEYESFGISVVEAMSAGVVPVLNDIAAFRYFHAGGNGELVDFRDSKAAAAAILRAQATAQERAVIARATAERYAWEGVVREVEAVYAGLVRA